MDFDKYFLLIEKRTIKISLPPDREALEKAFWAGFRYAEELKKDSKDSGDIDSLNIFKDIFGGKK